MARGVASPTRARAVVEGGGLHVMPCLYALLGASVAVFRNAARKGRAPLLDPLGHDRATRAIALGVAFGAVVDRPDRRHVDGAAAVGAGGRHAAPR